jgi:hypothetical protein
MCRLLSMEVLDKESAVLPFAQHSALTRGSHAAGSHVLAMCHVSRRRAAGQQSPRPHAALHNMMHSAAGFSKWYVAYHDAAVKTRLERR